MGYKLDFLLQSVLYHSLDPETAFCIEKLRWKLERHFIWIPLAGDALVSRARSVAASLFLRSGEAPYLIFLDGDIKFEPQDIERLYQHLNNGYDLIGGLYIVRDGSQPAHFGLDDIDGKIHEVEYLSTGFTGISARLLQKMVDELELPELNQNDFSRCWPFFEAGRYTERENPIYISEDWDFCEKARKVGVKAYCDTGIQLGHIGKKMWTVEDLSKHLEQKATQENSASRESGAPSAEIKMEGK